MSWSAAEAKLARRISKNLDLDTITINDKNDLVHLV